MKLYKLAYLALFISFYIIGQAAWWMLYPYKVIETYTDMIPMVTKEVKAGEGIIFTADIYQNYDGIPVTVSRQLVDGVIINYPDVGYTTVKGPFKYNNASLVIPEYVPAGKYHIEIFSKFSVNPLRTITIHRRTEDFMVK